VVLGVALLYYHHPCNNINVCYLCIFSYRPPHTHTQSYRLSMTLQNMNQLRLVPRKDYVANRLVSGALQLASNTSLYLDETQLQQGQLDPTGEGGEGSPRPRPSACLPACLEGGGARGLEQPMSSPAPTAGGAGGGFQNTNNQCLLVYLFSDE